MKKFLAVSALALGLTLSACGNPAEPVSVDSPTPSVSASAEPTAAPSKAPKPAKTTAAPAPSAGPTEVFVAPENYATDAPEYVEPVEAPVVPAEPVQAPVEAAPVPVAPVNPEPVGQTIPVPVQDVQTAPPAPAETFVPREFAEPTPEGLVQAEDGSFVPRSFYEPTPPGTSVAETYKGYPGECENAGMVTRADGTCYVPGLSPQWSAPAGYEHIPGPIFDTNPTVSNEQCQAQGWKVRIDNSCYDPTTGVAEPWLYESTIKPACGEGYIKVDDYRNCIRPQK